LNKNNLVCTGCFSLQRRKIFVYVDKMTKEVFLISNENLFTTEELFLHLKCKRDFCKIPISKKNILLIDSVGKQLAINDRRDAELINKCR
jgi:hypothetical protein